MRRTSKKNRLPVLEAVAGFFMWIAKVIALLLPPVLLAAAFYFSFFGIRNALYADDFFNIRVLDIQTNGSLGREDIKKIAGISEGDHLLRTDIQDIARRLHQDWRIRWVKVERELPDRLHIHVFERKAFIKIQRPRDQVTYTMDREGFFTGKAPAASTLTLFADARPNSANYFRDKQYSDRRVLGIVFDIKDRLEKEKLLQGRALEKIEYHGTSKILFMFDRGLAVFLTEDWPHDLGRMDALRAVITQEINDIEYLDLRFDEIVVKKKNTKA